MPEFIFDSIEAIPEEMREGLKPNDDGKVTINLVSNKTLTEFRDNNVALAKERDAIKADNVKLVTIVGDDPESFSTDLAALRLTSQKVEDGDLTAKGDIEEAVSKRVAEQVGEMKSSYEAQIQAQGAEVVKANDRADASDTKFKRTQIDSAVTAAVLDENSGALPSALTQILRDAYEVFIVEDNGSLTPKNGEVTIYGADGTNPMTVVEWLAKLKETAPFFFKSSHGGGAEGGKDSKLAGMSREAFDKLPAKDRLRLANEGQA